MKIVTAYILKTSCRFPTNRAVFLTNYKKAAVFLTNRAVFSYKSGQSCRFSSNPAKAAVFPLKHHVLLPFFFKSGQSCRFCLNPTKAAVFLQIRPKLPFFCHFTWKPRFGYLKHHVLCVEYSGNHDSNNGVF